MSESNLAEDLAAIRIQKTLDGPRVPCNPLVRLMKDTAQPMKQIEVVDLETRVREIVVVPDIPTADDLIRHVKYSNARAKARVALAHLKGTQQRFEEQKKR